ncbi:hypothetical protein JCM10908_002668 [Rhodotorula pacifica]|uniref:uncharacterized protein n=1 Tax=Rhodotorula pacifica TaxID=1495444 RepID=UPI00316EF6F1
MREQPPTSPPFNRHDLLIIIHPDSPLAEALDETRATFEAYGVGTVWTRFERQIWRRLKKAGVSVVLEEGEGAFSDLVAQVEELRVWLIPQARQRPEELPKYAERELQAIIPVIIKAVREYAVWVWKDHTEAEAEQEVRSPAPTYYSQEVSVFKR